jgi:hypothetical protein
MTAGVCIDNHACINYEIVKSQIHHGDTETRRKKPKIKDFAP